MPRARREVNRYTLQVDIAEKARLMRAASLAQTDVEDFILRSALQRAEAVIRRAEHIVLSERDTRQGLDLLDNPPDENDRLFAAATALTAGR